MNFFPQNEVQKPVYNAAIKICSHLCNPYFNFFSQGKKQYACKVGLHVQLINGILLEHFQVNIITQRFVKSGSCIFSHLQGHFQKLCKSIFLLFSCIWQRKRFLAMAGIELVAAVSDKWFMLYFRKNTGNSSCTYTVQYRHKLLQANHR